MSQSPSPTETKQTAMVRVFQKDQEAMDALAPEMEVERGGSWSRAHIVELAMEALREKRAARAAEASQA